MPTASRRVALSAPHGLEVDPHEPGSPPAGWVRLRSLAIGVCGSDVHVFEGQHPFVSFPVHPGHEVVEEVVEAGLGAESRLGERVALEPSLTCGRCRHCRAGRYNICDHLKVMGFHVPEGMADTFLAPADRLRARPDGCGRRGADRADRRRDSRRASRGALCTPAKTTARRSRSMP